MGNDWEELTGTSGNAVGAAFEDAVGDQVESDRAAAKDRAWQEQEEALLADAIWPQDEGERISAEPKNKPTVFPDNDSDDEYPDLG